MTKLQLIERFHMAIDKEYNFVMIGVTVPNNINGELEYILNSSENFIDKLNYYNKTYDEKLVHHHNPDIRIETIEVFDSFRTDLSYRV